jgi:hypothetical protein
MDFSILGTFCISMYLCTMDNIKIASWKMKSRLNVRLLTRCVPTQQILSFNFSRTRI